MALQFEIGNFELLKGKASVYVLLCPREQPDIRSYRSLEDACATANAAGIATMLVPIIGGAPGFHNANVGIHLFRQTDCTHLFFAADDMLFPAHILVKLVEDDKDIVNGVYRKRRIDIIDPANYSASPDVFLQKLKEKGVYETEWGSGHTMMVKRPVIEKMAADYPELTYDVDKPEPHTVSALWLPMIHERKMLMDDWSFSLRARQSGFTIWEDFSLNCPHFGGDFISFPSMEKAAQ
jgi:hypothetical protein